MKTFYASGGDIWARKKGAGLSFVSHRPAGLRGRMAPAGKA